METITPPKAELYPTPRVTVDCVVMAGDYILVVKRGGEPHKGKYALPGGYFNPYDTVVNGVEIKSDDSLKSAAIRELREETGLIIENDEYEDLVLIGTYDGRDRHPQARVINIAYGIDFLDDEAVRKMTIAGDDATEVRWLSVNDEKDLEILKNLAFDHSQIVADFFFDFVLNSVYVD